MAEIILKTSDPQKASMVLKEALELEKNRIKYGLQLTRNRLKKFERKYKVASDIFFSEWSSEDLKGGDLEYVEWVGEYRVAMNLMDRLNTLKDLKYVS